MISALISVSGFGRLGGVGVDGMSDRCLYDRIFDRDGVLSDEPVGDVSGRDLQGNGDMDLYIGKECKYFLNQSHLLSYVHHCHLCFGAPPTILF